MTALPGTNTGAMDINSNGDISEATGTTPAPIVYSGGTLYTLNRAYANVASYMLAHEFQRSRRGLRQACHRHGPRRHVCNRMDLHNFGRECCLPSATNISPYLTTAIFLLPGGPGLRHQQRGTSCRRLVVNLRFTAEQHQPARFSMT